MSAATAVKAPAGLDQVRKACAYIERNAEVSITLARLARHVNASPFHLQRTFTRIVGISPQLLSYNVRSGPPVPRSSSAASISASMATRTASSLGKSRLNRFLRESRASLPPEPWAK